MRENKRVSHFSPAWGFAFPAWGFAFPAWGFAFPA